MVGIIDSGASNTVMSYSTAQELQLSKHIRPVEMPFWNADGQQSVPVGLVRRVPLQVGAATLPLDIFVPRASNYEFLIGNDALAPPGGQHQLRTEPAV